MTESKIKLDAIVIRFEKSEISELAKRLLEIFGERRFICYLNGPLGSGKSTITAGMLKSLGLSSDVSVTSPTFTYVNEYTINTKLYAHLDLYRCDEDFEFRDLGLKDCEEYAGIWVEWPRRGNSAEFLPPTHEISIEVDGDTSRVLRVVQV